jgi:Raf kinase inhibitor-like YbhB/YbcL family protein
LIFFRRRRLEEYVVREGREFRLESTAFENGARIPPRYTCDGADVSPPLRWSNVPEGTRSFALIMYDPDAPAGTFIHWVLYDIPANVNQLPEDVPKRERVEGIGIQGVNDFGSVGYGGPCPPPGHGEHRYFFAIHALSVESIGLGPRAAADQVIERIRGKVLGYAILMGRYSR